jgi:O-antigen/teichoic acid export membrane protein
VILEHLLQELGRLLVVLARPLQATWVGLLRSGAWVYVVLGVALYRAESRTLQLIWECWLGGLLAALVLAVYALRDLAWNTLPSVPVDVPRLRRGLRVSFPYLVAAVADRGMYSADRYVLQWYWGPAAVGVYTFFSSVANSLQIALEAAVVQIFYPSLIPKEGASRTLEYRALMQRFARWIALTMLGLVALAAAGIFLVLPLVHNAAYSKHLDVYWVLLLAAAVLGLGLIPHYALYALREDRVVTSSRIVGFAVAVVVDVLLIPSLGAVGAAWSLVAGASASALLNLFALRRSERLEQQSHDA